MDGANIRLRSMQLYGEDESRERAQHNRAQQRSRRTKSYRKSDYCTSGRGLVLSSWPKLGAVEADVGREKA